MIEVPLLRDLGIMLVAATGVLLAARPLRVPSIVVFILTGLFVGPATGLVGVTEGVDLISEIGIALLLFLVGLELSFDRLRDVGGVALFAGLGQVAFTAGGGFGLSLLLGFPAGDALFIAIALTFSSTVVVVKLLDQKKDLNELYGRIAVGIFLVQDVVVIVALTVLAGLGGSEQMELGSVIRELIAAFGGMGLLLATAVLSARYLLPRAFGWAAASLEVLFLWSLCWCFLFILGAEAMELSLEIGAFLAGISLAQLPYNRDLRRRVHPLMNFFLAIFFVTLGVRMELGAAAEHLGAAAVLSGFVLVGKAVLFMWIIVRMGYGERTSFLSSVTVAQISEFSFIFAAMALGAGLIDQAILSLIGIVGLVTIGISSYMILYNEELYAWSRRAGLLRIFGAKREEPAEKEDDGLSGHIIVIGMNSLGRILATELVRRGERVLAVDTDPAKLADLPAETLLGNVEYPAVLDEARLSRARLLVSALQIEDINNLLAYRCRSLGVPVSIHAFNPTVVEELLEIGVDHLMVSREDGTRRFAAGLREVGVLT